MASEMGVTVDLNDDGQHRTVVAGGYWELMTMATMYLRTQMLILLTVTQPETGVPAILEDTANDVER